VIDGLWMFLSMQGALRSSRVLNVHRQIAPMESVGQVVLATACQEREVESLDLAKGWLDAIAASERVAVNMRQRRLAALDRLREGTQSVAATWMTGTGHWGQGNAQCVAWLQSGLSGEVEKRMAAMQASFEFERWLRHPCAVGSTYQGQTCQRRCDVHREEEWYACRLYRESFRVLGIDDWLTVIRCRGLNGWSALTLYRDHRLTPYSVPQRDAIDLVFAAKHWFQSDLPSVAMDGCQRLKRRERQVLQLLLDGQPRKSIASRVGLSLHMVNDSIKAIYRTFGTRSAVELASLFLQGSHGSDF
jgi:DNA-binding CsgD family transcriptional regulator